MVIRANPTSKYRAQPTVVDGVRFASKREAARYAELKLLEKAGEIRGLVLQPRFELHAAMTLRDVGRGRDPARIGCYVGDFAFEERAVPPGGPVAFRREWRRVVEDVKGFKTPLYRWKAKHVSAEYGIVIREVR